MLADAYSKTHVVRYSESSSHVIFRGTKENLIFKNIGNVAVRLIYNGEC